MHNYDKKHSADAYYDLNIPGKPKLLVEREGKLLLKDLLLSQG